MRRVTLAKCSRAFSAVLEIVECDDYRDKVPSECWNGISLALETLSAVEMALAPSPSPEEPDDD